MRRAKKKGIEREGETSYPIRAIDALIGDEKQTGKGKKEQKERHRERSSSPANLNIR